MPQSVAKICLVKPESNTLRLLMQGKITESPAYLPRLDSPCGNLSTAEIDCDIEEKTIIYLEGSQMDVDQLHGLSLEKLRMIVHVILHVSMTDSCFMKSEIPSSFTCFDRLLSDCTQEGVQKLLSAPDMCTNLSDKDEGEEEACAACPRASTQIDITSNSLVRFCSTT